MKLSLNPLNHEVSVFCGNGFNDQNSSKKTGDISPSPHNRACSNSVLLVSIIIC